jgi:mRNA interferase HigB
MHVITRKRLNEFAALHPNTRSALAQWYRIVKENNFSNFAELRQLIPSADQVGKLTVFNIGGNKARLVAAIHYNRSKVYIRAILTHANTTKGDGKNDSEY